MAIRSTAAMLAFLACAGAASLRAWGEEGPVAVLPSVTSERPAHPPLGVNLEAVGDGARSMVFVDCMKGARKFGSPDKPWDGSAPVDANGWPTADAGAVVFADVPVPEGNYIFSCTGYCQLGAPVSNVRITSVGYDHASNTTRGMVVVDAETDHLYLSFTHTHGGVKNIRLTRPGYTGDTKAIFNRAFLEAIKPFSTLRCMDFTRTNGNDVANWEDRPKVTDARQSGKHGVAWEYCIDLANESGKDLWINVPDRATDDYVRHLAELFKEKLDPQRVVYLEYSNEVWNTLFAQGGRNLEAAQKEVAAGNTALTDGGKDQNKYYWAWKRVPERLLQIAAIFRQVFGEKAMMTRIRPVLASQSANTFMTRMQVEFIANHYGPPDKFIYGIAGAPYLDPDGKLSNRDDLTVDQLLDEGFAHSISGWFQTVTTTYQAIADYYHLHSMCYEGGISLGGDHGFKAKLAAQYDPRIGKITRAYLNQWYAQGGDLFMYYNLCGTYSKWGCWGLTDDIRKMRPKMQAAVAVAREETPALAAGALVPGRVAAAEYVQNSGGGKSDDGFGGQCLAYLGKGSWFDYLLNVPAEGDYHLILQTASPSDGGKVECRIDDQVVGTVTCKGTGDWMKWGSDAPLAVHLAKGQYVLRLRVVEPGANIRSIVFEQRRE